MNVTYYGLGEAVPVEPDESVIEYVEVPVGSNGALITAFARLTTTSRTSLLLKYIYG